MSLLEQDNIDLITSSLEFDQYDHLVYRSDRSHQNAFVFNQFLAQENLDIDNYLKFTSYSAALPFGVLLSFLIKTTTIRPSLLNSSLFFSILTAAGVSLWMWNRNNQAASEFFFLNQDQSFISNMSSAKNDHLQSHHQQNQYVQSESFDPSSNHKPPQTPIMIPAVHSLDLQDTDHDSVKNTEKISTNLRSANLFSYQISPFHTLKKAPFFNNDNLKHFVSSMIKDNSINTDIWNSFFVKIENLTYQDIATKHSVSSEEVEKIHVNIKMQFAALMLENISPSKSMKVFKYFPDTAPLEHLEKIYLSMDYDEIIFRYLEYSKDHHYDSDPHFLNPLKNSPESLKKHHIETFHQEILFNDNYHSPKIKEKFKRIYYSIMLGLDGADDKDTILSLLDSNYGTSTKRNLFSTTQLRNLEMIIKSYIKEIVLFGKVVMSSRNTMVGLVQTNLPLELEQQRQIYQDIDKEILLYGFEMDFLQKNYIKKNKISKSKAMDGIASFELSIRGFPILEQAYYGLVARIDGTDLNDMISRYQSSKNHISALKKQIISLIIDAVHYGHDNYIMNAGLYNFSNKTLDFAELENQYYQMIVKPYPVSYRLLSYHPFTKDQKLTLLQFSADEYSFLIKKITDKLDRMISRIVNNVNNEDISYKISTELCRYIFFTKFLNIGPYNPQFISYHYSIPLDYVENIARSIYIEIILFLSRYKLMPTRPVHSPENQKVFIKQANSMLKLLNLSTKEIVDLHKHAFSIDIDDSQSEQLDLIARDNFFHFLFEDVINDHVYWIVYTYLVEIEQISDSDRVYLSNYNDDQLDRISTIIHNKIKNYFVTFLASR